MSAVKSAIGCPILSRVRRSRVHAYMNVWGGDGQSKVTTADAVPSLERRASMKVP